MTRSPIRPAAALALVLLAGGCRSTDPFCRANNAASLTPSQDAYRRMSPVERLAAQKRLDEASARCGWEP